MTMKKKPESTFIANARQEIEKIFEKRYCTLRAAASNGVEPLMEAIVSLEDEIKSMYDGVNTPDSVLFELIAAEKMLGNIYSLYVFTKPEGSTFTYRFSKAVRHIAFNESRRFASIAEIEFGQLKACPVRAIGMVCENYIDPKDTTLRNFWTEAGHDPMD